VESKAFDEWLAGLDLSFWGTAQHKVMPSQFFELQANEGAVLLDLRSPEESGYLALPFAMHIPIHELPDRWQEVPADRLVATFCSSVTRAVVAWVYLQLKGLDKVRILDARYPELTAELKPGKVYKRTKQ
jgi:rhodanese-related sulfurtransferase